jgi:hypothetical protein
VFAAAASFGGAERCCADLLSVGGFWVSVAAVSLQQTLIIQTVALHFKYI